MDFNFFVLYQLPVVVLLFVLLLFACFVELAKPVLDTVLELAFVFGIVGIEQFAFSVRLIVLPLAIVLNSFVLVNLQASAFLFAVDPLSAKEITIGIEHGAISMRYSIELLTFVSIFFDNFGGLSDISDGLLRCCLDLLLLLFLFDFFGFLRGVFGFILRGNRNNV